MQIFNIGRFNVFVDYSAHDITVIVVDSADTQVYLAHIGPKSLKLKNKTDNPSAQNIAIDGQYRFYAHEDNTGEPNGNAYFSPSAVAIQFSVMQDDGSKYLTTAKARLMPVTSSAERFARVNN